MSARLGALSALALLAACASREDAPTAPAAPPVERLFLRAPESGHAHEIDIFRPSAPPPEGGYPVVLLLDGNRVSEVIRAAQGDGVRLDAVYVTLGYRGVREFAVKERALDYTPEIEAGARPADPLSEDRVNGGAGDFRRFIEREVKPAVSSRAPVDWRESTLWGHSYGGLFVLYAMLEDPGAYARYIAVDPSLWWRDAYLFERLMHEEVVTSARVQLLGANADLPRAGHGRDPARVALRERLHAALPEGALEQVATRWGATYRYYPSHTHGSLFAESLGELLGPPGLNPGAAN